MRRHHAGLADAMIYNAVEQFLPAGAAGAVLGLALIRFSPENLWMLPGLWQLILGSVLLLTILFLPEGIGSIAARWRRREKVAP